MILAEYVRFRDADRILWGEKQGGVVSALSAAPWLAHTEIGERFDYNDIETLAPAQPSKIVCVGLNYRDHAAEMKMEIPHEPQLFLKPTSALQHPGRNIHLPHASHRVDYEAELAVVIGKRIGPGDDVSDAIFGYTCANDVTARDLQKTDVQWTRAKGFDTFCPLGPSLRTGINLASASIQCELNGEIRQKSNLNNLIFSPEQIVHFIAGVMTLMPGDVVLTGTPGGIGPMKAGDEVKISIDGLEPLQNIAVDF
jgi:2-keto-4-pentenoate hydratase/2-oxohepta-3-ene-1,7-dioic acid hydratase in catechol pathway